MNIKASVLTILAALAMTACDDSTSSLGSSIIPKEDILQVTDSMHYATSRTIAFDDGLLVRSSDCYVGRHTDSETGVYIEADFLTQLNCTEGFQFPDSVFGLEQFHFSDSINGLMQGIQPYTANFKLYFDEFTGDEDNPIKVEVWPLTNVLDPECRYYNDIDPTLFYDVTGQPLASATIAPKDYAERDSIINSSNYTRCAHITLPDSIAERFLRTYYAEGGKDKFKDAPSFIDNVCKGFYVRCVQGDGNILRVYKTKLEIKFYHISDGSDESTFQAAVAEFLGNSEVMQTTRFISKGKESLINDARNTYITSPFGLLTELTLPVDEIIDDSDYIINSASMSLQLTVPSDKYALPSPDAVLMVKKSNLREFFEKASKEDNIISYYSSLDTKFNEYSFSNISRLLMECATNRNEWLSEKGMALNAESKAAFGQENPDWNKVVIIPVEAVKDGSNNTIYLTVDMFPSSAKLVGGTDGEKIPIKVIKTDFTVK